MNSQQTPWRTVLEKLTIAQLVNKFPLLYGTLNFITVFTKTICLGPTWVKSIQFAPYYSTIHFNILLPLTLRTHGFRQESYIPVSSSMCRITFPSSWPGDPSTIWSRVQIMKLLVVQFSPDFCLRIILRSSSTWHMYVYILVNGTLCRVQ
jgi:hypothetical protein